MNYEFLILNSELSPLQKGQLYREEAKVAKKN